MANNINFNNSQKEDICNKYTSGESTYSISKAYNCSNVTISKILKSEGIKIRGNKKFKKTIELEICDKYKDGTHSYKLSETYNCSITAVIGALKRNGIKMRTNEESHKKYSLNEDYFNYIDTEDKAYWLGWLYSDGCNQKNYNVSIGLHKNDVHVIFHYFFIYINGIGDFAIIGAIILSTSLKIKLVVDILLSLSLLLLSPSTKFMLSESLRQISLPTPIS